jgi:hypothetical protein
MGRPCRLAAGAVGVDLRVFSKAMAATRRPKSDPHRCPACDASFEVTYFDDRTGERAHLPMASVDVACPACGRMRSLSLPAGAESTIRVDLIEGPEADEGGGG